MVGTFREPSCGRSMTPIHSIPYSVAHLWREVYKYYSYIIRGSGLVLLPAVVPLSKRLPLIPRGAVGDSRLRGAFALQFVQHNRDGIASLSIPPSRLRRATSLWSIPPSRLRRATSLLKKGGITGGFWAVLLHTVAPLSKRLPFPQRGAVSEAD